MVPVRTEDQAWDLLAQWRQAESVTVYAMPNLSALSVQWDAGENASWAAELWTGDYQGDWQALLAALFAADIPKVSHNVKDLMRTLLDAAFRRRASCSTPPWRPTCWTPPPGNTTCPGCLWPISTRSCQSPPIWSRTPSLLWGTRLPPGRRCTAMVQR